MTWESGSNRTVTVPASGVLTPHRHLAQLGPVPGAVPSVGGRQLRGVGDGGGVERVEVCGATPEPHPTVSTATQMLAGRLRVGLTAGPTLGPSTALHRAVCPRPALAGADRTHPSRRAPLIGRHPRPVSTPTLRVAVVGAGPAGIYAADILSKTDLDVSIDLYERLPAPFGLISATASRRTTRASSRSSSPCTRCSSAATSNQGSPAGRCSRRVRAPPAAPCRTVLGTSVGPAVRLTFLARQHLDTRETAGGVAPHTSTRSTPPRLRVPAAAPRVRGRHPGLPSCARCRSG